MNSIGDHGRTRPPGAWRIYWAYGSDETNGEDLGSVITVLGIGPRLEEIALADPAGEGTLRMLFGYDTRALRAQTTAAHRTAPAAPAPAPPPAQLPWKARLMLSPNTRRALTGMRLLRWIAVAHLLVATGYAVAQSPALR